MKIKLNDAAILGGAILLLLTGCTTPNIEIKASSDLVRHYGIMPSLEVDIAAITLQEEKQLQELEVNQYFMPSNTLRPVLEPASLYFSVNTSDIAQLSRKDPCWDSWDKKETEKLLLIVNLPTEGSQAPSKGKVDGRRLIIEDPGWSFFPRTLHFMITPNGITQLK